MNIIKLKASLGYKIQHDLAAIDIHLTSDLNSSKSLHGLKKQLDEAVG